MFLRIAVSALLAVLSMDAHAGTVLEMKQRDLEARRPETSIRTYAQDGRMRIEMPAHGSVLIFKEGAVYVLHMRERRYTVMDRRTVQDLAGKLAPARKDLHGALSRLPPDQRARMEQMLSGPSQPNAPTRREIRRTSRTGRVGTRSCTYAEVHERGALAMEFCIARASAVEGADELIRSSTQMNALLNEMQSAFGDLAGLPAAGTGTEDYGELGGVPLLTRHYREGKAVLESTLESIRSEDLDAALFTVPQDYRKATTPR